MAAYVRGLAGRQLTELASYVETRSHQPWLAA
jgi:hypothetical protein